VIRFAVKRVGWAVLVSFLASIIAFLLFWTIPNVDPAYKLGGSRHGTDKSRAEARAQYGLDDPLPVQYERLMKGVVTGSVPCFYSCPSLRDAFIERLPVTFWLIAGAAVLSIGLGILFALICVRYQDGWQDRLILSFARIVYSVPSLVLAAVLWGFLCSRLQIFPDQGYTSLTRDPIGWADHLFLPWIAAGLPFAGAYTQLVRASLLESAREEWVKTARAKGLSRREVLVRHVLRNGLIPPVNVWGLDFSHAFGGFALYVEVIFQLPGIGSLTSETLAGYDLPPIVALACYLAVVVVFFGALVDIVVARLDPRIRSERAAAT
jgi:peptide/nickel transport system permease protein